LNLRCHLTITAPAITMAADALFLIEAGARHGTGPARGKLKGLARSLSWRLLHLIAWLLDRRRRSQRARSQQQNGKQQKR
jgi:hypothetical protein